MTAKVAKVRLLGGALIDVSPDVWRAYYDDGITRDEFLWHIGRLPEAKPKEEAPVK